MRNHIEDGDDDACLLRKATRTLLLLPESYLRQKVIVYLPLPREQGSSVPDPIPSETWIPAELSYFVSTSSVCFGTRFLPRRNEKYKLKFWATHF